MRESEYLEGNEQIVETLKTISVFKNCSEDSLRELVRVTKLRRFSPSEVVMEEGDTGKFMYILISGSVSISKGGNIITSMRRTGDVFGEMGLIEDEPRSATVVSTAESSCLMIDASYLDELKEEGEATFHAAIYQMFAQILAYRLRITTEKYAQAQKEIDVLRRELTALFEKNKG